MMLRRILSKWRQILIILGTLCVLAVIGFVGFFLWAIYTYEDKAGEIQFRGDPSLVLQKKSSGGIAYKIDNARATFRLDVAGADKNCERLFPSYAAALKFAQETGLPSIPSVQLIHGKCKQFDDDLCVVLEEALQTGSNGIPGKSHALQSLAQRLIEAREAAPATARPTIQKALLYVATAVSLGGGSVAVDPALAAEVDRRKTEFLKSPQAAPVGFWTETETLRQIFVQDRYLMRGLQLETDTEAGIVLAQVISSDPELSRAFDLFRSFDAKLTNRPVYIRQDVTAAQPARAVSVREIAAALPQGVPLADMLAPEKLSDIRKKLVGSLGRNAGFALCNYATSPEYSLLLEAFRNGTLSSRNASLGLIIDAVKSGRISLKPKEDSGWYDYQWYALETLLLPERATESPKLTLTDAYKKRLEEAFKSSIAKNRETHIKQLPEFTLGMKGEPDIPPPKLDIHPEFSAEPTITVYLRTARAYRFLHTALTTVLGDETLRSLRRTSPGNPESLGLGDELNRMALLCYGIDYTVSTELGLVPSYLPDEISATDLDTAKRLASQWIANVATDPDLAHDTRIAVPAIANPDGTHDYWATGGIRLQRVRYDYKREPDVMDATPIFVPGYYYLPTDVSLEFQRGGILSRDEFRRLCDSCNDEASLRRLLGASDGSAPFWNLSHTICAGAVFLLAGAGLIIAWRKKRALTKRVVLWAVAVVVLFVAGWSLRMYFDPAYRMRFVIRHVVNRSPLMAYFYRNWSLDPYRGGKETPPAVLRSLVDLLRDPDPQVRYIAVSYLGFLGWLEPSNLLTVEGSEERLREVAEESDPQLAAPALSLLGAFRDDRNVEFLRAKVNDRTNDEPTRFGALFGLVQTSDVRGIDAVISCTHMSNEFLRERAIYFLGGYDDPRSLDVIADLLASSDANSSKSALRALAHFHYTYPKHDVSGRMDTLLLTAARNPTFGYDLRSKLAEAIRDEPTRILAYENMLFFPGSQDAKSVVRCQQGAVRGLEEMKSAATRVIPILQKALEDLNLDPEVRQDIEKAVAYLRKKS